MPQRNITPWADLATMPAPRITELLTSAVRREDCESLRAAEARYYGDTDRSKRAERQAAFWEATHYATMFTIEDRLNKGDSK